MIGDLYFAVRKLGVSVLLILMAASTMEAQEVCNNTDPGTNAGDLGCVSFVYNGQQVTYTTVRAADGKIWLQQNLGSSRTAESTNDEEAYGDLFQWGRWDDGHQLRNSATGSVPSVNKPDGLQGSSEYITGGWWSSNGSGDKWTGTTLTDVTETESIDPCKTIGPNWALPSQADWESIVPLESISSITKAYEGRLKLPMGGYRSSGGALTFVGQRGYFWSSGTAISGGKYLYIGTLSVNPSAGGPRGQGASVRCVKTEAGLGTTDFAFSRKSVEVYPNPTKGILMLKTDAVIQRVKIVNAIGQTMEADFSDRQINMNGLAQGLYWVEIQLKNGETVLKKIMKN